MESRPRSAVRTAAAVIQQSTELERGGMVGSGQYGVSKNATTAADSVPVPTPLIVPPQPGSPHNVTSPDAAPSPGPPSVNAADLRAMVRALDESQDDAMLAATSREDESSPGPISARRSVPASLATGTSAASNTASPPRPGSRLERVYSPKGSPSSSSGIGGPGAVAPTLPRSPGGSPGRQRGTTGPQRGGSPIRAGPGPGPAPDCPGSRPWTPLQATYGPPPPVADADEVLGPVAARSLANAVALRAQADVTPDPPPPQSSSSSITVSSASAAGDGRGPRPSPARGSAAQSSRGSDGGSTATIAAAAPTSAVAARPSTPSKFAAAYGVQGDRPPSRASPSAASASPVPSSSRQHPGPAAASGSPGPAAARPSSAARTPSPSRDPGTAAAGSGRQTPGNGSARLPHDSGGGKPGSPAAVNNGWGSPYSPSYGGAGGGGRGTSRSYGAAGGGAGGGAYRGSPVGVGAAAAGPAARTGGRKTRREELFEEEDPYVVLEQSIALLSEIEGLIRSSVELPPDHPLDGISREVAIEIPTELLEALEDTLEVIAMAREEIAALEARGAQQRRHSGAAATAGGPKPPLGSHSPTAPTQQQRPYGAGAYGTGGGAGRLSRSGSRDGSGGSGGGLAGERSRSSRGSWSGGAGGAAGGGALAGGGSSQYLPPISSSVSVGSRVGSAAHGRPPSHGRSPTHSPQQHQQPGGGPPRAGSASRRVSRGSLSGGSSNGGGGGSVTSIPSLAAALSNRRAWHREAPPEEWVAQKKERAEVERRKREAQLASDLKYLQQIRSRSSEVQQTHEALLAQAEESVRAARSAKASSEAQHRWLQYQQTVAEGARRHYEVLMGPGHH